MGCWNKTCGLSRLHIYAGTPVYVFLITQDVSSDNRCYSTALFQPLMAPFDSEYNDYGAGENSGGPWFEYIMAAIKKNLVELEVGENKYHDIAVKKADFSEKLFFDAAHEHRLSVVNALRSEMKLEFVMMRKDVVDDVLRKLKYRHFVRIDEDTKQSVYDTFTFTDLLAEIPSLVDVLRSELDAANQKDTADIVRMIMGMRSGFASLNIDRNKFRSLRFFESVRSYGTLSSLLNIEFTITEAIEEGNYQEAALLLTDYLIACCIHDFMDSTRMIWAPGCHEGSQACELDNYEILTSVINNAVRKEKQEQED